MGPHGIDNISGHRHLDPWDPKLNNFNFMLQFSKTYPYFVGDFIDRNHRTPSAEECREYAKEQYPYISEMSKINDGWETKHGPIDATCGYSKGFDFSARLKVRNNDTIARMGYNGENQIVGPNIHLFATDRCELTRLQNMMRNNVIYALGDHGIDGTSAYIPIGQTWDQTHSCYRTGSSQQTYTNSYAYSSRDSSRAPIYTPVIVF